jgi:hypothetical protein
LQYSTTYHFCSFATNAQGTTYGSDASFATLSPFTPGYAPGTTRVVGGAIVH